MWGGPFSVKHCPDFLIPSGFRKGNPPAELFFQSSFFDVGQKRKKRLVFREKLDCVCFETGHFHKGLDQKLKKFGFIQQMADKLPVFSGQALFQKFAVEPDVCDRSFYLVGDIGDEFLYGLTLSGQIFSRSCSRGTVRPLFARRR